MSNKYALAAMRYTLVVRDGVSQRIAALNTPRSLVDLNGLLGSAFRLYPEAMRVDVFLASQSLDDECIVSAERYSGPGGQFTWYKPRTLKAIEGDLRRAGELADVEPEVMA